MTNALQGAPMLQGFFVQFLIILLFAVVAITCLRYLQLPPILAYLGVGVFVGPDLLDWVSYTPTIQLLSELGVVFLLFMLGLEFSLPRMLAMRKTVFGLGFLQVLITTLLIYTAARLLGVATVPAIVIAGALSLSSTAIVTRELLQASELNTGHGQISVGILLFQDLAAVVFLIIVPALSGPADIDLHSVLWKLLEGAGLLLLLLFFGRTLLPWLFHEVAKSHSDELFVMTALVASLAAAWLTHSAGLSMALGGFLAGMMLGESRYKHQLQADIRPFRDLLLGLFFVSVGLQLDITTLFEHALWLLLIIAGLIILKTITTALLALLFHKDHLNALRAGMGLSQGGEFGFALLAVAAGHSLVPTDISAIITATIILSMVCTPPLIQLARRLSGYFAPPHRPVRMHPFTSTHHLQSETAPLKKPVIICGYGRVGQVISRFLKTLEIPYVIMDSDPVRVRESAAAGEQIYYGDVKRFDLMRSLGCERARLILITFPDEAEALQTLQTLRAQGIRAPILVRTRDDGQLEALQQAGATEIVPELLEGSLMLVSHVLTLLGVPAEEIKTRIRQVRTERYQLLQGYYHGSSSRKIDAEGQPNTLLHPIFLSPGCAACQHTIAELNLARFDAQIRTIRRDNQTLQSPPADTQLQPNDTLIVQMPSNQLEFVEAALLSG